MRCHDEQGEPVGGQDEQPDTETSSRINPADHIALVYEVARGFLRPGRDIEDLASAGKIGLMKAAHKFDPARDRKFSSYAVPAIKNQIVKLIRKEGWPVRVPFDLVKVVNASDRGEPLPIPFDSKMRPQLERRIEEAKQVMQSRIHGTCIRFNFEYLCEIHDNSAARMEGIEDHAKAVSVTRELLNRLAKRWPRDASIIRMRYGLDCAGPMTSDEIGRTLGISRQAVTSAENKAMERLRALAGTDGGPKARERRERRERLKERQNRKRNEKRSMMVAERKARERATQERGAAV